MATVTLTRNELLDMLTTAALVGMDIQSSLDYAMTRGDVTEVVERRMRKELP